MRLPLTSLIIVSSPVVSARLASIYYILVQEFNARYYRYNSSLVFDLTVSSLRPDLNVTARIGLNAYGMEPVDLSFDLCELTKALCPLPKYNLSGAGTIPIPEFEDYIPGIAWIVPDLEAAAQLTLTRIETQEVVGCVQATLSNGHSLRQKSVGWAVGGLLLAMFSLSVILTTFQPAITLLSESSAVSTLQSLLYQWMSLLTLCQTIVASALLHLNYPIAYRSYAVNFSWAFGLFHSSPNSALQRSMQHLREHTGSNSAKEGVLEPIEFVDRQMSPYNDISGLWKRVFEHRWHSKRQFIQPVTVTPEEVDRLQAGIPLYVNSIGIATGNSFLSVLYSTLILIGCIGVIAATGILLWSFRQWQMRSGPDRRSNINLIMGQYWTGLKKIILRISYVGVMPILTMAFYQWTIGDSWLAILLSVLLVVFVGCIIGYNAFALVRAIRNHGSNLGYLQAFHEPYRPSRWYYAAVPLFQAILKAVFISFARDSGLTQAIAFIIIDLSVLVLMVFSRPHVMSRLDIFEGFLYLVRLITSGLLIAFVESIGVKPIPRAIIAFVAVLVWSIGIVACFVNLLATLVAVAIEACAVQRAGYPSKREGGEEELREVKKDVASPQISDKTFVGAKIMESPFEPSTMVFSEVASRASYKTDSVARSLSKSMQKGPTELSEKGCEYERPHSAYSIEGDLTSSLTPTARLSAFGLLDTGISSNPLLPHCGAQQSSTSIMMPNPPTDTPSPRTPTFDHVSATVGRLTPGYSSLGGRDSPHSAIVEGHMQLKRDADAIRRAQTSTPGTFGGRESPLDHFAS